MLIFNLFTVFDPIIECQSQMLEIDKKTLLRISKKHYTMGIKVYNSIQSRIGSSKFSANISQ
jgi:hypothetical protein